MALIAHRCPGCTRLSYPSPDAERPLRSDAVIFIVGREQRTMLSDLAWERVKAARGLADRGGVGDQDHDEHARRLLGIGGEFAVARVLGLPFDPKPFGDDVNGYQVRTRARHDYDLILQDHDLQHHRTTVFILVTADGQHADGFILRGWYTPREASEHPEWRRSYGGFREAWFVPQIHLHDLWRLPERMAVLKSGEPLLQTPVLSSDAPDFV